jgi:hypothetical protein
VTTKRGLALPWVKSRFCFADKGISTNGLPNPHRRETMIGVIVAMVVAGAFSLIVYRNYNVYIRYSDAPHQFKRLI